jgi:hypothetical protein
VNLDFLIEILVSRGFGKTWIEWIKKTILGGAVSILANGEESNNFKTGKGVRQGDPLSPLLFNLVGDVLTRMLAKVADQGLVKGVLGDFRASGILSLQYVDDTLLFSDCGGYYLRNLKIVLSLFERISGMRINFNKSEFIPMHLADEQVHDVAHILNCNIGTLPFVYLGVPLHVKILKREDIRPLVDKLVKKVAGWRGRLLAYSSRLTLIKSCLASIPVYLLSFIKFSKWAIKFLQTQMAHCLWNNSEECHRYHLANWKHVSMEKEYGGLGVPNLRDLNICLL